MAHKTTADCSTGVVETAPLTPDEQAAYDAQQTIGGAQATALTALTRLQGQHRDALSAIRDGLTASDQATTGDLAALRTVAVALQAGAAPTQAQLLQLLRFVLRVLALDRAI